MKVSYYPGCSLKGTARDYAASVETVCSLLGIDLCELEDWNCCGATAAHSLNHRIAVNLAGRNLALAEKVGRDMVVPCPLCFNRLKTAETELLGGNKDEYEVSFAGNKIRVWDLANFIAQVEILDKISKVVKKSLKGLKAVCYYGCMSSRPPRITGEKDYEDPMSMDRILQRLGVEVIQWCHKTDCCGAGHLVPRPDIVFELVGRLYENAHRAGANCIVVSCQMCHANLDLRQAEILKQAGAHYKFPVFYFTELIALALWHKDISTWLTKHFVDPVAVLKEQCHLSLPA